MFRSKTERDRSLTHETGAGKLEHIAKIHTTGYRQHVDDAHGFKLLIMLFCLNYVVSTTICITSQYSVHF